MKRLASLSVDLDEIHHYRAIHGLSAAGAAPRASVYELAIPRFEALAAARSVPLTFFAVGTDAARPSNAEALRRLVQAGHEIGNHSWEHRYDLTLLSSEQMRRQVDEGAAAIEAATGVSPLGFRAPGYLMNDRLADVLARSAVSYDSSVFPCPAYYAAKAAVLAAQRFGRRRSTSVVDSPAVLLAPRTPYRLGRPYYRRGDGLLELPIQVTPRLRLPVIGTALTLAGPALAGWLTRQVAQLDFVNLELHGIDLLEAQDGLEGLARHQPDLKVPLAQKCAVLETVIDVLHARGFQFVRLNEAARSLAARV